MRRFLGILLILIPCFSLAQEVKKDSVNEEIEKQIKAVELVVKKKVVERKADRLVFNVEHSISATGGDGMDALRVAPGVKVENDKISIVGKSSVLVLIDDRPLQMSGDELANYLRSIKSEDIKSIEVMTNPPSKYIAEGNGGVINIITKKQRNNAWNASLRSVYRQATYPMGSWGGSFNIQRNRWTFSSSINYRSGSNISEDYEDIYYPNHHWLMESNNKNSQRGFFGRLGLDYKISEKHSMGFVYRRINSIPIHQNISKTKVVDTKTRRLEKLILSKGETDTRYHSHLFNYHWVYKIDSTGKKLSFDYDAMFHLTDKERNVLTEQAQTPKIKNKSWGLQDIKNHSFSLDMEHPLEKISLNYGARFSFSKINNNSKAYDFQNDKEVLNAQQSNEFLYRENTQALYFTANKKWGEKWDTKAGLRLENTQTEVPLMKEIKTNISSFSQRCI